LFLTLLLKSIKNLLNINNNKIFSKTEKKNKEWIQNAGERRSHCNDMAALLLLLQLLGVTSHVTRESSVAFTGSSAVLHCAGACAAFSGGIRMLPGIRWRGKSLSGVIYLLEGQINIAQAFALHINDWRCYHEMRFESPKCVKMCLRQRLCRRRSSPRLRSWTF